MLSIGFGFYSIGNLLNTVLVKKCRSSKYYVLVLLFQAKKFFSLADSKHSIMTSGL